MATSLVAFAADQHIFFVPVPDGRLNIRFVPRAGNAPPGVNAIQVTHRPDH